MPVEAAAGDAERLREQVDPHRVGPSAGERLQPGIDPAARGVRVWATIALSLVRLAGLDAASDRQAYSTVCLVQDRSTDREHTSRPWRIHEIAKDFRVLDVWALPTPGGPDDFPQLVRLMVDVRPRSDLARRARPVRDPVDDSDGCSGLDRPETGLGTRVQALRDRLPADLADTATDLRHGHPFTPLYVTDDEFAMEIANQTMHGVMQSAGCRTTRAAIAARWPFWCGRTECSGGLPGGDRAVPPLIVYPLMMRDIGRIWRERPVRGRNR